MCLLSGEAESRPTEPPEGARTCQVSPAKPAPGDRWPHRSQSVAYGVWEVQHPACSSLGWTCLQCRCWGIAAAGGMQAGSAPRKTSPELPLRVSRGKSKASPGFFCTNPRSVHLAHSEPGHTCCPEAMSWGPVCSSVPQMAATSSSPIWKTSRYRTISCNSPSPSR